MELFDGENRPVVIPESARESAGESRRIRDMMHRTPNTEWKQTSFRYGLDLIEAPEADDLLQQRLDTRTRVKAQHIRALLGLSDLRGWERTEGNRLFGIQLLGTLVENMRKRGLARFTDAGEPDSIAQRVNGLDPFMGEMSLFQQTMPLHGYAALQLTDLPDEGSFVVDFGIVRRLNGERYGFKNKGGLKPVTAATYFTLDPFKS